MLVQDKPNCSMLTISLQNYWVMNDQRHFQLPSRKVRHQYCAGSLTHYRWFHRAIMVTRYTDYRSDLEKSCGLRDKNNRRFPLKGHGQNHKTRARNLQTRYRFRRGELSWRLFDFHLLKKVESQFFWCGYVDV